MAKRSVFFFSTGCSEHAFLSLSAAVLAPGSGQVLSLDDVTFGPPNPVFRVPRLSPASVFLYDSSFLLSLVCPPQMRDMLPLQTLREVDLPTDFLPHPLLASLRNRRVRSSESPFYRLIQSGVPQPEFVCSAPVAASVDA